ncbi:hypothetical protein HXX76_011591 [Chlamydomonas incerta]|uniref:Phospholipase A2 n=1 Tax=Chlamydomonas incerta TaxID=51695 RepID=A0A835VWI6_CHLIN|nr:hypothetical protein HXX76_011591 [Chlamydomonas incerta]|eukprot:KAG2428473.1 hypothetical protein HXX76_011591 [Chlamydomonas incerta]
MVATPAAAVLMLLAFIALASPCVVGAARAPPSPLAPVTSSPLPSKFGQPDNVAKILDFWQQWNETSPNDWSGYDAALTAYIGSLRKAASSSGSSGGRPAAQAASSCSAPTCRRGQTLRQVRASSYNGCGADNGIKVPEFTFGSCCNSHDLCYGRCGSSRNGCDDNFFVCMRSTCSWWNVPCQALASTYYLGVVAMGCDAYSTAQNRLCACQNSG